MAIKYIQLQEAATMLGLSPEELTDMIGRREIFGYRDGSTWKFKEEEIRRVMEEKGLGATPPSLGDVGGSDLNLQDELSLEAPLTDGLDLDLGDDGDLLSGASDLDVGGSSVDLGNELSDLDLSLDGSTDDADVLEAPTAGDSDSILVSEEELGKSDDNTLSTIIGEPDELLPQDSSVGGDSNALGGSDLELELESSTNLSPADPGTSDVLGDADISLAPSDTANLNTEASGELKFEDSGTLDIGLEDTLGGGSGIDLSDDAQASSSGFGSAIDLGLDDDELVLGSGSGSDITAGAGDSGINLANPADSGLSLEEPLDLTGGSGVESLELGEDDMLVMDDDDDDGAEDNQFMLTPVEDSLDEESDSGSQVIAIDSEEFDENAIDMVEVDDDDDDAVDAFGGGLEADDDFGAGAAAAATATAATATAATAAVIRSDESDYSIWNVLSLFCIVALLGFTGILMADLINNIWSWDGNFSFNSSIMDAILAMMPG